MMDAKMNEQMVMVGLKPAELGLVYRGLMELPLKRTDPAFEVCSAALDAIQQAARKMQQPDVDMPGANAVEG
jgi:hypothetical protein